MQIPTCPGKYRVEYFNNADLLDPPVLVQCEEGPPISVDWIASPPPGGIGEIFSVRWTGAFYIAAGSYSFIANADDGIRVKFAGKWIIDEWHEHSISDGEYTGLLELPDPRFMSEIVVEYFENGIGQAAVKFEGTF